MKKIVLLTLTMLGALSCSTDEVAVQYDRSGMEKTNSQSEYVTMGVGLPICFSSLNAEVSVDVSGGFNNPVVVFTPIVNAAIPLTSRFWIRLEVQSLSDCDLISTGTGNVLTFGPSTPVQYVTSSPPSVSVLPANLPSCYKWRFVIEGVNSKGVITCSSFSRWQESPIF